MTKMLNRVIVFLLCAMFAVYSTCAFAQVESGDSQAVAVDSVATRAFRPKQLALPVSLIALGSFGAFHDFNNVVRDGFAGIRGTQYIKVDDYIQYVPVASYIGFGVVGIDCKHSFKERFMVGTTAYLAMGIMVNVTKYTVKEKRPDADTHNSFPSGHTATAFMGAELIRQEYGLGWSVGAYVVATGVAFLRIYNDRHWFCDVIAGAGIGILSARIGYWMLPLYQKWFHWDKERSFVVLPTYDAYNKAINLGMAISF